MLPVLRWLGAICEMSKSAYLTGSGVATPLRYSIRLSIPQEDWFLGAVKGALSSLCDSYNWQQHGTDTVEEVVEAAFSMFREMTNEGLYAMVGAIVPYATASAPINTLPCDGSTHEKADYPELYAVLDGAFIVDGDTFRTPDIRGRAVIGSGQGTGLTNRAIGSTGGAENHTLTEGEMPNHSHAITIYENLFVAPGEVPGADFAGVGFPIGIGTTPAGSGGSHNNMQPFSVLRYCIIAR